MGEPFIEEPVARRSRAGGWMYVVPLLFLGLLVLMVPSTVGAVRAQLVGGAPGTFVGETVECQRICDLVGTFTPAAGGEPVAADWGGQAYGASPGQPVEAILPEGSTTAFPPSGTWTWVALLAVCAVIGGGLVASIRALVRARRPLPSPLDDPA